LRLNALVVRRYPGIAVFHEGRLLCTGLVQRKGALFSVAVTFRDKWRGLFRDKWRSGLRQIVVNRPFLHAERLSDFADGEALFLQGTGARGRGFGGARLPSGIHAALAGKGNADSLPLLDVLQFDLGDAEQEAGDQMPDRAAQVDLLRTLALTAIDPFVRE
jgi:hypothetical protein